MFTASVARTFNGRPWRHVVLFLHPVDRNASAILQQGFNIAPEGAQISRVHAPERNSCIGDSAVWAPRHWSIVAEDSKMGSSKPPTQSVRSRPRSRHFPVVFLYLATGSDLARRMKKKIDLLIHTSLKISCTRVMART